MHPSGTSSIRPASRSARSTNTFSSFWPSQLRHSQTHTWSLSQYDLVHNLVLLLAHIRSLVEVGLPYLRPNRGHRLDSIQMQGQSRADICELSDNVSTGWFSSPMYFVNGCKASNTALYLCTRGQLRRCEHPVWESCTIPLQARGHRCHHPRWRCSTCQVLNPLYWSKLGGVTIFSEREAGWSAGVRANEGGRRKVKVK
jgi:hypothetical protein